MNGNRAYVLAGLLCATSALWADGGLSVKVRKENLSNGNVAYHYTVINNSDKEINRIIFGTGMVEDGGFTDCELGQIPPGTQTGMDDFAPTAWVESPTDWLAKYDQCENLNYELVFGVTRVEAVIKPGQTLTGFKVILPKEHAPYATAHFIAHIFRHQEKMIDNLQGNVEPDPDPAVKATKQTKLKKQIKKK